jgi:hypothetical protein
MKRKFFELIVGVVVICVVALQPGFAQGTGAGQGKDKATKEQSAAASEKTHPGEEGIKVHGHWVIDIRNPDGTLVSHREFENSIASSGPTLLSQVLARTAGVGYWGVAVGGSPEPCNFLGSPHACNIEEVASGGSSGDGLFFTLTVSSTSAGTLVMTGTAIADNTASINSVQTGNSWCPPNSAPGTPCKDGNLYYFTAATVSPAINVLAGQTIAVTVTISFS